jgi:uncharacterized protein YjbI with pentapeptide repeats
MLYYYTFSSFSIFFSFLLFFCLDTYFVLYYLLDITVSLFFDSTSFHFIIYLVMIFFLYYPSHLLLVTKHIENQDCNIQNKDYSSTQLLDHQYVNVSFTNCNFTDAVLDNFTFDACLFTDCTFKNTSTFLASPEPFQFFIFSIFNSMLFSFFL